MAADGSVLVTFELSSDVAFDSVFVCGEFNGWTHSHPLDFEGDAFRTTLKLKPGRAYRFRYFFDGGRWENDWAADSYVRNEFGGEDSVVDLTALNGPPPPPVHLPPSQEQVALVAETVRAALQGGDIGALADLLDPNARWGPPGDDLSGCHDREEVLAWYRRTLAAGVRAELTEVLAGAGAIVVGLQVEVCSDAGHPGGSSPRWQVMSLREGRIADIRGFDDREMAMESAGLGE